MTYMMQIERGAPTHDLAFVRNQVDAMKGGRITKMLTPAKMVHILALDINEPTVAGVAGYHDLIVQ
jgi:glycerate-2-kinase